MMIILTGKMVEKIRGSIPWDETRTVCGITQDENGDVIVHTSSEPMNIGSAKAEVSAEIDWLSKVLAEISKH